MRVLWASKNTEETGKARNAKSSIRSTHAASFKHNFNHRWKPANILFQITLSLLRQLEAEISKGFFLPIHLKSLSSEKHAVP